MALRHLLRANISHPSAFIVTFMGCHVASSSKLVGLRACLQSIQKQTWAEKHGRGALCLLVSWSASTEELAKQARRLFAELVPEQTVLEQPCTRSQFEHYREVAVLVRRLRDATLRRALWVGFSDDDDVRGVHNRIHCLLSTFIHSRALFFTRPCLCQPPPAQIWHPRRLETFYQGVAQIASEAQVTQLRFPWFAVRRDGAPAACERVRSAAEVDAVSYTHLTLPTICSV